MLTNSKNLKLKVLIITTLTLTACAPQSSMPISGQNYLHKDLDEYSEIEEVSEKEEKSEKVAKSGGVFSSIRNAIGNIFKKDKKEDDIVMKATLDGYLHLPIEASTFTSMYGVRSLSISKQAFHSGIDFGVKAGTPIQSVYDGRVVKNEYSSGWGNYVEVESSMNGETYRFLYAHMKEKSKLKVGDVVRLGEQIGLVGSTGDSTGPHLHFEILIKDPDREKVLKEVDSKHHNNLKKSAWWWDNSNNWSRLDPAKYFTELSNIARTPHSVRRNNSPIIMPNPIDIGSGMTLEGT